MSKAPELKLTCEPGEELQGLGCRGRTPQRVAERCRSVLLAAAGRTHGQLAQQLGMSRQRAGRWRERFARQGLAGLLQDKAGRGRKPTVEGPQKAEVVRRTLAETPPGAPPWSTRRRAKACGLGATSGRAIGHAPGLKPHLVRGFKLSTDPRFVEKLAAIEAYLAEHNRSPKPFIGTAKATDILAKVQRARAAATQ